MHSRQPLTSSALQPLGKRIAALAVAQPDRPAVVSVDVRAGGREVITWAELDAHTRRTSHALRTAVSDHQEPPIVWITASNLVSDIVSLLGGLRAGLVVACLDATAPPTDIDRTVAAIEGAHGHATSLTDLLEQTTVAQTGSEAAGDEPSDGSWILMTGGSTGVPTPIAGPATPTWNPQHGAPLLLQRAGWQPGQVQLVVGPLHHAAPFSSFIDGVLSGNTLVLANGYYPELLFDLVDEYQVEWMQLTPVHMRMADPLIEVRVNQLRSVRAVLHTAAPCPSDTKRRWIAALGADRVFEMYAATESIGTTLCSGVEWLQRPGTVGRGFLTRIRVLDDQRRDVPSGDVGEVYMRSLRPSPAASRYDGLRGFRSVGDHGHLDSDGYLYLSGRADDLVIVGGENVYLGEVEFALLAHDGVSDAAVVANADDMLHASLHAYVVPRDGAHLDERKLQAHCRQQLPAAKRPRAFHIVADLPRSAAGKLMRREVGAWPNL